MKIEYMSDEYLMNMVEAIEAHDMVSAPPDLQSGVFAKLGLKEGSNRQTADSLSNNAATKQTNISTVQSVGAPSVARRKPEFRIYCFKVIGASAAAILIALSLPVLSPEKAPTPTKQEVVGSMTATDIGGKDGVVGNIFKELASFRGSAVESASDSQGEPNDESANESPNETDNSPKGTDGILKNLDRGLLRKLGSSKNVGDYFNDAD